MTGQGTLPTLMVTLLPLLRFDPYKDNLVPPDTGAKRGKILLRPTSTKENKSRVSAVLLDDLPTATLTEPVDVPFSTTHRIVRLISYPITWHLLPPTKTRSLTSSIEVPRSLPEIVMTVPPSCGPEWGWN